MSIEVNWDDYNRRKQHEEGTGHIKFGVGVGIAGAASMALIGATCPLCFFVAPAMVGLGVWKRRQAAAPDEPTSDEPTLA